MTSNVTVSEQRPYAPGSVRAARERMKALRETGATSPIPQPIAEERAYIEPRSVPNPPSTERYRQPLPIALQDARNGPGVGTVISNPIPQDPQWPLNDQTIDSVQGGFDFRDLTPPSSLGSRTKQQFARPSLAPPMFESGLLDNAYNQSPAGRRQISEQYSDAGSSVYYNPVSPPSRIPSEISSMGSIPDFPVPQQTGTGQSRNRGSLGPPPSARRAPPSSSFYTNTSYVPPIPEETERARSRGSYASSSAIPSSWGDESPDYQFEYETEDQFSPEMLEHRSDEEQNAHQESNDDTEGLVRSASIGKRSRPTIVMTRSSHNNSTRRINDDGIVMSTIASLDSESVPSNTLSFPYSSNNTTRSTYSPLADAQAPLRAPFSATTGDDYLVSPSGTIPIMFSRSMTSDSATLGALAPPRMSKLFPPDNQIPSLDQVSGMKSLSTRLSALRRPKLRVDIDAVREAEKRGSLTSLPDLIKRATRLAWLIDKNNRPGSRLNDLYVYSGQEISKIESAEKSKNVSPATKHTSGLSGMLSAFPPPGTMSSLRNSFEKQVRPVSVWPEGYAQPADNFEIQNSPRDVRTEGNPSRRCCGLPLWGFIILLLILLLIIAAAVVVPLELLVLRKKTSSAMSATTTPDLASCQSTTTCANDGSVVVADGMCACMCINGFTGSTCTMKGGGLCMMMPMTNTTTGTTMNVTLGSAIDRVIAGSQPNFSIPLDATLLVAKFAAVNLSCAAQNALITFDGSSGRAGGGISSIVSWSSSTVMSPSGIVSSVPATTTSATRVTVVVPGASTSILHARDDLPVAVQETDIVSGGQIHLSVSFDNHVSTAMALTTTASLLVASSIRAPTTTSCSTTFTANIISAITTNTISTPPITTETMLQGTLPTSIAQISTQPPSAASPTTLLKTNELLDFARVVTLFVLQKQSFDVAVSAQTFMQTFFNGAVNGGFSTDNLSKAGNVSIGNGNSVDFRTEKVFLSGNAGGTFGGGRST